MKMEIAGVLVVLMACVGMAQQGVFDKAAILRELDKLEQSHKDKVAVEQKSSVETLHKALTSTKALLDLYQESVFGAKFEGGKKDTAEFRRWRDAQDDTLKSDDFQAALSIHANYLNLTLLRASGENEGKLNEALIQHVIKVWASEGKFDLHTQANAELLDRPINQGLLARHLQMGPMLGGPREGENPKEQDKTWEWLPANADGMLDKTVFPFLRKNKSPMLMTLWDKRITSETARAKRSGVNVTSPKFTQQMLPKLQWPRACDQVLMGNEAEGFSTMIGILRQNANHAEFDKYAKDLRVLLAGEETRSSIP